MRGLIRVSEHFGDPSGCFINHLDGDFFMRCREDRWYRSVDYRLYPNATQTKVLENTLDVLCDLYNRLLDIGLESLKEGRRLTAFDMMSRRPRSLIRILFSRRTSTPHAGTASPSVLSRPCPDASMSNPRTASSIAPSIRVRRGSTPSRTLS